jgi:hypothetical protein
VTQRKYSRAHGIDVVSSHKHLLHWCKTEGPAAEASKRRALLEALDVLERVRRYRLYARARDQALAVVPSGKIEFIELGPPQPGGSNCVVSEFKVEVGEFGSDWTIRPFREVEATTYDVAAALFAILRKASFKWRECVGLLDDGAGDGPDGKTHRIDRAKKMLRRAPPDPHEFLEKTLAVDASGFFERPVKRHLRLWGGNPGLSGETAIPQVRMPATGLGSQSQADANASERAVAGGGSRARDARTGGDCAVVGPDGQASGLETRAAPVGAAERPRETASPSRRAAPGDSGAAQRRGQRGSARRTKRTGT